MYACSYRDLRILRGWGWGVLGRNSPKGGGGRNRRILENTDKPKKLAGGGGVNHLPPLGYAIAQLIITIIILSML